MSSIIKVDQIQKADGSTPTAGDLGISNTPGSVLQVVQGQLTTTTVIDSSAYQSIVSASITPTSTSSKILVMATVSTAMSANGSSFFRLYRGSTAIGIGTDANGNEKTSFEVDNEGSPGDGKLTGAMNWLDSPSTTSQLTYSLQGHRSTDSVAKLYINRTPNYPSSTTFDTNSVTTITVMEIAG